LAQLVAYSTTAIISFFLILKNIKPVKLTFNKLYTLTLLKNSAPYALLIFLMFIYNRIDAIMLERMLPDGKLQAGIYAQGFRYLDAVNMIALLFAGLLLPIFARLIKENKPVYQMVLTPFKLLIPGAVLIGILGFFFGDTIMNWRYISETDASAASFSILILSFIPISLTYIFGTLLTANGNLKALNYMALFGVILNLTLNFILIPVLRSEGAAIATLITQTLTAIIQIVMAFYLFKFTIDWAIVTRIFVFSFIVIAVNSAWFLHVSGLGTVSKNLQLLSMFLLGIVLMLAFKFLSIKEMIQLIKPQKTR
jgi:O-antigen/teichoic acid export membrane protein